MTYTIFCKRQGDEFAQIVGSTGSLRNAQSIARDYAEAYGHAFIVQRETTDRWHYRAGKPVSAT